jgi:hypothetical protein
LVHRALPTVAILAVLSGCSWDRRHDVALVTLINDRGAFDEAAYGAAIRARYPEGSPVKPLLGYVKEAKGDCNPREEGHLWCEIPTRGGLCWTQLIGLDVAVSENVVRGIKVHVGALGC